MSSALNLHISSQGQLVDSDAGPAGLRLFVEDFVIDHVDSSEVGNIRQEDVDLDDVVNAASGGVQNGAQIGQRLSLSKNIS
jgi:hypothetical protein